MKKENTLIICQDNTKWTRTILSDYQLFIKQDLNAHLSMMHKEIIITDANKIRNRLYLPISNVLLDGMHFDNIEIKFYRPTLKEIDMLAHVLGRIKSTIITIDHHRYKEFSNK
ncbi:hypothetical protein DS832_07015 [Bombilactobacillus bombi]|uniref:Uncharacterized protein n=1 Tax=Bombilactobacillus bombi TaxID=1303590 RepID=A0A3R6YIY5_9LACO|nr:hypothetical protein [Bombilactobacillus bombi]RHW46093.1 hypothetical protein DS832_07015 [Bombilactobacillus bombi]